MIYTEFKKQNFLGLQWYTSIIATNEGGVHMLGEICPRSDPDIAHMG